MIFPVEYSVDYWDLGLVSGAKTTNTNRDHPSGIVSVPLLVGEGN
jgi:hypothetical protein